MAWCYDATGNDIGSAHANPILDTRMCQVEFAGDKVTELTDNVIAESMYAQSDTDGNEYLTLDLLVAYYKDNKAISLIDQQASIRDRPVTHKMTAG